MNKDTKDILNDFYKKYNKKVISLTKLLSKEYKVKYEYTNKYTKESYPLPVIYVDKLYEIVLNEYEIDINTKISKNKLLKLDFDKFNKYDFEIYSPFDYYDDIYEKGMPIDELKDKIKKYSYKNFGLTFIVSLDMPNTKINKLIDLLNTYN